MRHCKPRAPRRKRRNDYEGENHERTAPIAALWIGLIASSWVTARAQEKAEPAPANRAARPLIRVPTTLPLDEARVIVEAAKAVVKAENGRAATVGSAGHRGDGDVRAVKAGMAAWEKLRQGKKSESMR